jgi:uncharacterized ferritin-like protein (DUF455 family)
VKRHMSPSELARDSRFIRSKIEDQILDPRQVTLGEQRQEGRLNNLDPRSPDSTDASRALMHGIFVGEIQALEGAGRTCWDFVTGEEVPFELKLDMARQCWDEARHCEISLKLADHMGTEIGEFAEGTVLFEAACSSDAVLRLAGVNRALEGLAIDVFNTMRELGENYGDPVLYFCEDWMLADEVTHVKMGSDWLRKITASDPERREKALEFQRTVDKLFSFGGFRSEEAESPVHLARKFRNLAGFDDKEIQGLVELGQQAIEEQQQQAELAAALFSSQSTGA